jgi:hypothetical protein
MIISYCVTNRQLGPNGPTTPHMQRLSAITHVWFGLFLWVLRCFTSPRSLLPPYVFRRRSPDITPVSFEVSLFGDPRIEACLPAPRGLSQVTTSFIGSWCLGIHRLPLVACCYYKDARVHCEVLNIRAVSRVGSGEPAPVRWRWLPIATETSGPNSVPQVISCT